VPAESNHRDQARLNRDFAAALFGNSPNDPAAMQWAVTAAFYCAVHCIEAHFATLGLHSSTHVQREAQMANPSRGVPPDVFAAYRQLKDWSIQARYRLRRFSSATVQQQVLGQQLPIVTSFISL
jgi:hypothetical protein